MPKYKVKLERVIVFELEADNAEEAVEECYDLLRDDPDFDPWDFEVTVEKISDFG